MASRCLNRVSLIGNLTRDPELRYTPSGEAVCSLGLATNRSWTTQQGEKKESAEFHRLVAWNKLAELCSQLLTKGRKIFVEGRIQYREWTDQEDNKKQTTEIVIDDMIILDSRSDRPASGGQVGQGGDFADVSFDEKLGDVQLDDVVGIESAGAVEGEKLTEEPKEEPKEEPQKESQEEVKEEPKKEDLK